MSDPDQKPLRGRGDYDLPEYRLALRRYFQKRAPPAMVEDLVQEVFANLQSRRAQAAIEDMDRYLFVVAGNVLSRERRRARPWTGLDEAGDLEALRDPLSPEQILVGKQGLRAAIDVINTLPARTRQVFLLHRFEEMTYQSIARGLGVSVSAVEKHIMTALRALTLDRERRS